MLADTLGDIVFSDEFARLLQQPSPAMAMRVVNEFLNQLAAADNCPEILSTINDLLIGPYDEIFGAMKALRAVGHPVPFPESRDAAKTIFAPEIKANLSACLQTLVTSCRTSRYWDNAIDNYWAKAKREDEVAHEFGLLCRGMAGGDLGHFMLFRDKMVMWSFLRPGAFGQWKVHMKSFSI